MLVEPRMELALLAAISLITGTIIFPDRNDFINFKRILKLNTVRSLMRIRMRRYCEESRFH